ANQTATSSSDDTYNTNISTLSLHDALPISVRHSLETNRFPRDALNQWRLSFHPLSVFLFEMDGLASSLTTGLLARSAGPGNHRTFPKNFEGVHQDAAKTGAVTQQ